MDAGTNQEKGRRELRARRGFRLVAPRFHHLRTRLTAAYLTLFIAVLTVVMAAVYTSIRENADRAVRRDLVASAVVFDRVWGLRTAQLRDSADLLAHDFGFRAALASNDAATIHSALANLRGRSGLDFAFVVGPDGQVIAVDGAVLSSAAAAALPSLAAGDDEATGVFTLDGVPYQGVGVPILAPVPIGRLVFAARLDAREMQDLARLAPIALQPQILVQTAAGRWSAGADVSSDERAAAAHVLARQGATAPSTMRFGPWVEVVRPLPSLGDGRAGLLLRYPLAEALKPFRPLLALILLLGMAGLTLVAFGGWALARQVTRPIADLKAAAEQLERGEVARVEVSGADEIAALGDTFNHMVAEIVRREDALELARAEAEAANQAKSDFLANMSHEIRTPLNGILGMAQVMARDEDDPKALERARLIHESGEALLAILNSILDLSKIEAGQLEIELAPFDAAELVSSACAPFAALARDKGLGLQVEIAPEAAGLWTGDALRIRQVLANLVSNAVKFTSAGGVTVRLSATAAGLTMAVRDTGAGIERAQLERIFERFAQADGSATRRFAGAGLGLSICRELVGLMGGRISVASEPGDGACFTCELPLLRAAEVPDAHPASSPAQAAEGGALRVLAAEDNPTNRAILAALLEPVDLELSMVEDGRQAVEAAARGSFDLILMDIQMPVLDGVAAAREIRRLEQDAGRAPTPILAVTANVMAHQLAEYTEAGMIGVVSKPVKAELLYAAIERALEDGAAAAAA